MSEKYLKWLLQSRRVLILFTIFVSVVILLVPYVGSNISWHATVIMAAVLSVGIAMLFTYLQFSYIHHKRSVDMYFSLPVSRKDQLITGCIFVWITASLVFVAGTLLVWLLYQHSSISFLNVLSADLWMIFALMVIVLCTALVNAVTNNVFDAFVMLCAYSALPFMVSIAAGVFTSTILPGYPAVSVSDIIWLSPPAMTIANVSALTDPAAAFSIACLIAMIVFLVLSAFGLQKEFIQRKSERAEQISSDFFAYPFIINIYAVMVLLIWAMYTVHEGLIADGMLIYYVILFVIYMAASFVYRRSFHINWKVIAVFCIEIALTYGFAVWAWKTNGFGLAYQYPSEADSCVLYTYNGEVSASDLGQASDDDHVNVSFSIQLPSDKNEQEKELQKQLEAYRRDQISAFYKNKNSSSWMGSFDVQQVNNSPGYIAGHTYSYEVYKLLSEDELKKLSSEGIAITVADYTDESSAEVPLAKYLEERSAD